jgi:nicotinamide-nucleotide amidase
LHIELINTGTELLLGRVLNSHQQWICQQLADRGYEVTRQVCVADSAAQIRSAVNEALSRADLVITTGGLGPTSDDLTREVIAELFGKTLVIDVGVLAEIEKFFALRKKPVPERSKVQALVPEGSIVFPNRNGLAPGLATNRGGMNENNPQWLIMLPGPPRELRPMFIEFALPFIQKQFPASSPFFFRTIRTAGIGESAVADRVSEPLQQLIASGLELGYCARVGQVDVRVAARNQRADELIRSAERIVCEQLGDFVFGFEEDQLEHVIVRELTAHKKTLLVAESCTGGQIANRITNVPGASAIFLAGQVTYSNEAKQKFLGVRAETLAQHGAVSEAVAREMAEGARKQTGADFALSVTGIAGPNGGSDAKPVGTVFIGLTGDFPTVVIRNSNPFDRVTFKEVTATQALDLLRQKLMQPK